MFPFLYNQLSSIDVQACLFSIPAFYRGFLPTMIGIIPYAGTSFSTYEMLKKYRADKAREEGLKPTDPSPYQRLIFGGIAGLLGQGTYTVLHIFAQFGLFKK